MELKTYLRKSSAWRRIDTLAKMFGNVDFTVTRYGDAFVVTACLDHHMELDANLLREQGVRITPLTKRGAEIRWG